MTEQAPKIFDLNALLAITDFTGYTVIRRGYRKCRVAGDDVTEGPFGYSSVSEFNRLQDRLAAAAGEGPDNHESYQVRSPDGQELCLSFSDWNLAVGTKLSRF